MTRSTVVFGRRIIAAVVSVAVSFGLMQATSHAVDTTPVMLGIAPRDGVQQKYDANVPALHWAIRNSFRNYVGKANHILDGAAQGQDNDFIWPFKSVAEDKQKKETTISFGGTVNFLKYCDNNREVRGNCYLDFTVSDPKVVYRESDGRGQLLATVYTRNYSTQQFEGPKEIVFGVLDFTGARYNQDGDVMHWSNVGANLTKEGNHAFSDFYYEGGPLASLAFSFKGKVNVPRRDSYVLAGNKSNDDVEYVSSNQLFTTANGSHVIQFVAGKDNNGTILVYDKDLTRKVHKKTIKLGGKAAAAFDSKQDVLYWSDDSKIYKALLAGGIVGTETVVHTLPQNRKVTGMVYSPKRGEVAVIHRERQGNAANAQFILLKESGVTKTLELPGLKHYYPHALDTVRDDIWGEGTSLFGTELQPLPDGTFIFSHAFQIDLSKPKDDFVGSTPLHITPDALPASDAGAAGQKNLEIARKIDALDKNFIHNNAGYVGIVTDNNGNIALYNSREETNAKKSWLLTATYTNGVFGNVKETKDVKEAQLFAAAAFSQQGQLALVSENKNRVFFLNPKTHEVQSSSAADNLKDTARTTNRGAVFASDGSLYVVQNTQLNYQDRAGVQRLAPPSSIEQRDSSLKAYTVGGHEASAAEQAEKQYQIELEKRDAAKNGNESQRDEAKKRFDSQFKKQTDNQKSTTPAAVTSTSMLPVIIGGIIGGVALLGLMWLMMRFFVRI